MESVKGIKHMYKVTGRSGQLVYMMRQSTENSYSNEWGPIYQWTYDCKNWERRIENDPWGPIVPGSVGDGIARDVCTR